MKTIAIVEDDVHIGDMLAQTLSREGYAVLRASTGPQALGLFSQNRPDLVLLDLMLPGLPGEEILPRIRNIPVIVLSAKTQVQDKVNLLRGGAADYMTKPFATEELLARVAVQLRRAEEGGDILYHGDLCMDLRGMTASVCGQPVRLTRTEYAILKLLLENPKRVIARSVLLERIGADTPDCTERSLKQHVSNLRRKLREAGSEDTVETVWGIGFKLTGGKS